MGDFLAELLKSFGVSTRSRLITVLVVIVVCTIGLLCYERYTASFRLGRLQKEAELLTRLQQAEGSQTNNVQEIERARATLVAQTVQTIEERPLSLEFIPTRLTFSMDNVWKFLSASAIWLLYAIGQLRKIKSKDGKETFIAYIALAAVTGFLGLFVPPILWPWFHLLIFPWLLIVLFILAILPFAVVPAFRAARKKAQKMTCLNNLRLLDAAKQQWALENGKTDTDAPTAAELESYTGMCRLPTCPSGGKYTIGSMSTVPHCSHADHALEAQNDTKSD